MFPPFVVYRPKNAIVQDVKMKSIVVCVLRQNNYPIRRRKKSQLMRVYNVLWFRSEDAVCLVNLFLDVKAQRGVAWSVSEEKIPNQPCSTQLQVLTLLYCLLLVLHTDLALHLFSWHQIIFTKYANK